MTSLTDTQSPHGVSVVVPVFNSEATLPELVARLEVVLGDGSRDFEVLLVNDGSRDRSWQVIQQLADQHDWVRGIDLSRNYGQHNALLCGIRAACYPVTVTIDDDLQNPPEQIGKLLAELDRGHDVVYGTPIRQRHGLWRDLASSVSKLVLQHFMGADTARKVSAFRAFRTNLRDAFASYRNPQVSIDVLLTWGTTRFTAVKVEHDSRSDGESSYTFTKLLEHALNMMTGFSSLPLRLASWIGFVFTIFGFLVFAYVVFVYLTFGGKVPGFTFLASIIAIFSGAQLFTLGIIGEYLTRIHWRTMDRPPYLVSATTKPDDEG